MKNSVSKVSRGTAVAGLIAVAGILVGCGNSTPNRVTGQDLVVWQSEIPTASCEVLKQRRDWIDDITLNNNYRSPRGNTARIKIAFMKVGYNMRQESVRRCGEAPMDPQIERMMQRYLG